MRDLFPETGRHWRLDDEIPTMCFQPQRAYMAVMEQNENARPAP